MVVMHNGGLMRLRVGEWTGGKEFRGKQET